ncbi:MAG: hypothetical protein V2A62_03560 [Candidatus Woesearchaeota archaeon]
MDYLREFLSTEESLKKILDSNFLNDYSTQFDYFAKSVVSDLTEDKIMGKSTSNSNGNTFYRARPPVFDYPRLAKDYGIVVPEEHYSQYIGTVPITSGGADYSEISGTYGNSDLDILRNKYIPRFLKSQAEANQMMEEIKAKRTQQKTAAVNIPTVTEEEQGSSSTEVPAISQPKSEEQIPITAAAKTKINAAIQKALTEGISTEEADQIRKEVRSYKVNLPNTAAGKDVIAGFPEESRVSTIYATATQPIENMEFQADFFDIDKHPALFDKSVFIHDQGYPTPNIPPPEDKYQPIELIGLKTSWQGESVVLGAGKTSNEEWLANEASKLKDADLDNYFKDYYFTFRLPPEIITAGKIIVPQKTSSGDYMIDASWGLDHIILLHYNYETEEWDPVSTKSVGKCDLKFCAFTAGPTTGKSYYLIVREKESTNYAPWILLIAALVEVGVIILVQVMMNRKLKQYQKEKKEGKGTASLILGILSLLCFLAPYIGLILAGLSLIFSMIQNKVLPTKFSRAGFILGIIGLTLNSFAFLISIITLFAMV